jgi:hypothetical protein
MQHPHRQAKHPGDTLTAIQDNLPEQTWHTTPRAIVQVLKLIQQGGRDRGKVLPYRAVAVTVSREQLMNSLAFHGIPVKTIGYQGTNGALSAPRATKLASTG